MRARVIQHPMQSPDGAQLTFSALGRVYVMPLAPGAAPHALTRGPIGEYEPSWSADGRSILFVRWTAREGGQVWRAPAEGGAPVQLTDVPAYYTSPVETPDGLSVLVIRSSNDVRMHRYMEYGPLRDAELAVLPAGGGSTRVVAKGTLGGVPHFGPDPKRVAVLFDNGLNLVSLADGKRDLMLQVTGPGYYFLPSRAPVDDLRLSLDGQWVLAQIAQQLHVLEVPSKPGSTIDLAAPGVRHRRLTDVGADFLQWSGRTIGWGIGASWFRRRLADVALDGPDTVSRDPDVGTPLRSDAIVEVPRATAPGPLVLRGATVLAVPGTAPIPNADVLIVDGRFGAVGARGSFPVPAGATVRDVSGKWIVPGFIDDHDHVADIRRGVLDLESWGPAANLAYGITTAFDPSTLSIDMLPYQDSIDAGAMIGSRIRSTGVALFSFNEFTNKTAVDRVLDRYRDFYRLNNIKLYAQSRIFYAMGRDGLLPPIFSALHPRFRTPWLGTIVIAIGMALAAALLPITLLGDLISLGTASSFAIVSFAVIWLRKSEPGLRRPFSVPLGGVWIRGCWIGVVPVLGIIMCLVMVAPLGSDLVVKALHGDFAPALVLIGYLGVGALIYGLYGIRHSKLGSAAR